MAIAEKTDARTRLAVLRRQLRPRLALDDVVAALDEMFTAGRTPDPPPSGFLRGQLITTSVTGPIDGAARRMADLWMPWLGKSFEPATGSGVNVLVPGARRAMKLLWPSYEAVESEGRLEAFPFRTRVEPGELDPGIHVLKIDYDFEANPDFVIRKILDELVEIDDRLYLGKILYRRKGSFRGIGFFSLES